MKRSRAIAWLALAILATLPIRPATAEYSWQIPNSDVICAGGNTAGSTVGAWLALTQPQAYALMDPTSQLILNNVYAGTVCSLIKVEGIPLGSSGHSTDLQEPGSSGQTTIGGTYGTEPFGYCEPHPDLGTLAYPGCISAYIELDVTYNHGTFDYHTEVQIEADIYLAGDTATWTYTAESFKNNHGSIWQLATDTPYTFNYGDHRGYGIHAYGNASFTWVNYPDPFATWSNFTTESVHVGLKGEVTQHYAGAADTPQDACFFADFRANRASPYNGGWCINP